MTSTASASIFSAIAMAPRDPILGITEAFNLQGEEFGTERLEAALEAGLGQGAAALVGGILKATSDFAAEAEQSDDITALALIYRG